MDNRLENLLSEIFRCGYNDFNYDEYKLKFADIEQIIKNNQKQINEKCYETISHIKSFKIKKEIYDILNKYDNNDIDCDKCYICLSGRIKSTLLNNICTCKIYAHYHCIIDYIYHNKSFSCSICRRNLLIDEDNNHDDSAWFNKIIYFPYSNFYPVNLITNTFTSNKQNCEFEESLYLALEYLQIKRIENLIKDVQICKITSFLEKYKRRPIFSKNRLFIKNIKGDILLSINPVYTREINEKKFLDIENLMMNKINILLM
jgi:hypothetical protein